MHYDFDSAVFRFAGCVCIRSNGSAFSTTDGTNLVFRDSVLNQIPGHGKSTLGRQLPVVLPFVFGFSDGVGIGMAQNVDLFAGVLLPQYRVNMVQFGTGCFL